MLSGAMADLRENEPVQADERPFYEMPFFEGKTLTQLILKDKKDARFVLGKLRQVLAFWRDRLLPVKEAPVPEEYLYRVVDALEAHFCG